MFTKLAGFSGRATGLLSDMRRDLLSKIDSLKARESGDFTSDEKVLLNLQSLIYSITKSLAGIEVIERIFSSVDKFLSLPKVDPLSSSETVSLLSDGKLSALARACDRFKWSGGSGIPNGKSESDIGITDSLLDKLMGIVGADSLLNSWLRTGDSNWKRWADSEVKTRKDQLKSLKSRDPKSGFIRTLEYEIEKLEKDWKL